MQYLDTGTAATGHALFVARSSVGRLGGCFLAPSPLPGTWPSGPGDLAGALTLTQTQTLPTARYVAQENLSPVRDEFSARVRNVHLPAFFEVGRGGCRTRACKYLARGRVGLVGSLVGWRSLFAQKKTPVLYTYTHTCLYIYELAVV